MKNKSKSKFLNSIKRHWFDAFLGVVILLMVSICIAGYVNQGPKRIVSTEEFELVSCYVEIRDITNGFGGIEGTKEYLHYGYIDANGNVEFDEMQFQYANYNITEETSKLIVVKNNRGQTDTTFLLTKGMYNNLYAN